MVSFHSNPKEGQYQKYSNYCTIALISHASKVKLKILQAGLQQYMNLEFPDICKLGLQKAEEPEIKLPTSTESQKKQENSRKTYFCFTDYTKAFDYVDTTNCGRFLKRWEYQTTLPVSWETCIQEEKQQLEPNMEQSTCSKLGKEYIKALYCYPAYLTCMQSTS